MDPIQPIAPCAFGQWYNLIKDLSDIINIHEYPGTAGIRMIDGRPVIVSEWMYRAEGDQHPIQRLLPGYHAKKIGIWQWGLVNGDTQTHFPWGSPPGAPEPNIWHHDLYHRDGTAYDPNEIALYVQLSNTPPPEPPTIPSSTGLVQNGTFESTSGNGSTPDGWTKDFNSYGIYDGAAYSGAQGVHPGSSAGSGGLYQDITTVPGTTYSVTLMVQNFGGDAGSSHVRVLLGDSASVPVPIDDQGASTDAFDSAGIVANELFATNTAGTWAEVMFQFTATGTSTRLGVYNANMSGDTVHSINIDDVSGQSHGRGSE
jgi:hypothetical protein